MSIIAIEHGEIDARFDQDLFLLCAENSFLQNQAWYWSIEHFYLSLQNLRRKLERLEKQQKASKNKAK